MSRVLADASTLIALSRLGKLSLLKAAFGSVTTTRTVFEEAARPEFPEHEALEEARRIGWLRVLDPTTDAALPDSYGLGRGEASLFAVHQGGDLFLVDDGNARQLCDQRGIPKSGLTGLLAHMAQTGRITGESALEILDALASSSFRMSAELYAWARQQIDEAGRRKGGR